jgi:ABC-type nitrate/sulfonate/bicarbonate transport system substrate-binding protein
MALVALTASACASGGGSGRAAGEADDAGGTVNMVMAPDPVWKWLEDQGIKQEMEQKAGMQVLTSSSWDEFGVFAGGHADVISASTYEVPDLEESIGEPTTIFGMYNSDRSIIAVPAGSPYQDMCELKGKKIATFTSVSITLIWGMYIKDKCGLELGADGGDFELVVTDVQNMASLVDRGDADACICLPDFAMPELTSGRLRPLNDGQAAAQFWAKNYGSNPDSAIHPQNNVFVARKAWVEKNSDEAAFLISLWDRGVQEWQAHRDEIITAYPEDFAVRTPEEMAFLQNWLTTKYDWFAPTAYLDDAFVKEETEVFDLMRKTEFMDKDAPNPDFTLIKPAS